MDYKKELAEALELHQKAIEAKMDAIAKAKAEQFAALKAELAEQQKKNAEVQKQADELDLKIQKSEKTKAEAESQTLEKAFKQLLTSPEFVAAKNAGFPIGSQKFEIKADTSDITGSVNLTMQKLTLGFEPERQLAFMPFLSTGSVGSDKNRILWMEGTYTSNVGYVSEGTGQGTGDSGKAVEKTRGLAKVSAKLPLTAELLEDASYVASVFRMKMQERAMLWLDGELYDGDGDDITNTDHIYGIKGHATAYDATATGTGSAGLIEKANIGDLIDDVVLQAELAEQRGLNRMWINPRDFARFRHAKDANGQYLFVKAPNGQYTVSGLNVVRSASVPANEMLIADTSKIQLWWKRNPELKISQINGTDFVDDKYTAVLFLRNQLLIEGVDKKAVILVSDINAAITALTTPSGN